MLADGALNAKRRDGLMEGSLTAATGNNNVNGMRRMEMQRGVRLMQRRLDATELHKGHVQAKRD
jgi:hypothetical protein